MSSVASITCESANLVGWYVGGASATLADIVLLLRILLAPALGPSRQRRADSLSKARQWLHWLLVVVPIVWLSGGLWLGGAHVVCYARGVAISATLVVGVVLVVTLVSAANQIARRSVR